MMTIMILRRLEVGTVMKVAVVRADTVAFSVAVICTTYYLEIVFFFSRKE